MGINRLRSLTFELIFGGLLEGIVLLEAHSLNYIAHHHRYQISYRDSFQHADHSPISCTLLYLTIISICYCFSIADCIQR